MFSFVVQTVFGCVIIFKSQLIYPWERNLGTHLMRHCVSPIACLDVVVE